MVVAIAFACELIVTPLVVSAEEEGSGKGEHKAHHETTGEHAQGHMKEGGKGEPKKTSASPAETAAGHEHESPGAPDDDEKMEEGSH
jgi:hypothetical protein